MTHRTFPSLLVLLLASALQTAPATADPCPVPGSHPTIQNAVDDATCTTIELAAQTYVESVEIPRSLSLVGDAGGASLLEGSLAARGAGTVVTIETLAVSSGCPEGLLSAGGAQILGDGLQVDRSAAAPCPSALFGDDFESGDASAWFPGVPPTLTAPETGEETAP